MAETTVVTVYVPEAKVSWYTEDGWELVVSDENTPDGFVRMELGV